MNNINITNNAIKQILFTPEEIQEQVARIGEQISEEYSGKEILVVGILRGSVIFVSDLIRHISCDCSIDFMTVQSYGDSAVSGSVKLTQDLHSDIRGKHVIVVEDILDTAKTLAFVREVLLGRNPASFKICTLLNKRVPKVENIVADYKCFDVNNEFVVGYGLDYAQKYRNLPYVGVLKEEIWKN